MNEYSWQEYCNRVRQLEKRVKALEQQQPCEDAISRQAAIKAAMQDVNDKRTHGFNAGATRAANRIKLLPSVTPQPKIGHWIISPNDCFVQCSKCGLHGDKGIYKHYRWCPNCGAKMVEPQESEDEE